MSLDVMPLGSSRRGPLHSLVELGVRAVEGRGKEGDAVEILLRSVPDRRRLHYRARIGRESPGQAGPHRRRALRHCVHVRSACPSTRIIWLEALE